MVPSSLEQITLEDVSTHLYELYIDNPPGKDLGMISKQDNLDLSVQDTDYSFEQSISNLNSSSSSTGFVLWKISIPFVEWLITRQMYDFNGKFVVEIGSGVTGLLASTIGLRSRHYISTDQYHLLKLLKKNIVNNVQCFKSSTMQCEGKPRKNQIMPILDCCTYDWEEIDQGLYEIRKLNPNKPDFILGCDVVYNDYLVPYLVEAIDGLAGDDTKVIIGLQLRLPENTELFVTTLLDRAFKVYKHDESILTDDLKLGYVVYLITK